MNFSKRPGTGRKPVRLQPRVAKASEPTAKAIPRVASKSLPVANPKFTRL